MKRLLLTIALTAMLTLPIAVAGIQGDSQDPVSEPGPQALPQELLPQPKGITELASSELATRVAEVVSDARYEALRRVAEERQFFLDTNRAKGRKYPEGDQAVFVRAFDHQDREVGFLVSSNEVWTLSLVVKRGGKNAVETFAAKLNQDGQVVVEQGPVPQMADAEVADADSHDSAANSASATATCRYVSKYGVNFGCVNLRSNPFGYYYVVLYRWGTTPDPRSPSWWACYRGSIHICPRYEAQGSPLSYPVCGFPPSHPQG